jgi:hypothetical protein
LKAIGIGKGKEKGGMTQAIPGVRRRQPALPRDDRHSSKGSAKTKTSLELSRSAADGPIGPVGH